MLRPITFLAGFLALINASPFDNHVRHEQRETPPLGWLKTERMEPGTLLPIRVALKQRNIEKINDYLMAVSHPESSTYGHHWSPEDVEKEFSPSSDTLDSVMSWLLQSGIGAHRISLSRGQGWLAFDATVQEAEQLLKTQYHKYVHTVSGQTHPACNEYHLPQAISEHVDFITPTLHFDVHLKRPSERSHTIETRDVEQNWEVSGDLRKRLSLPDCPNSPISLPISSIPILSGILQALGGFFVILPKLLCIVTNWRDAILKDNCQTAITPACLRQLYSIPFNNQSQLNVNNSLAVVEFSPVQHLPSDLTLFNTALGQPGLGSKQPILVSVDDGTIDLLNINPNNQAEADLDIEYTQTFVFPGDVLLYQVGDNGTYTASFNTFLAALDTEYCQSYAPNEVDPFYSQLTCGTAPLAKVISLSYGYPEAALTYAYEYRQCMEYAKLGMMGATVIFASGDNGVASGAPGSPECLDPNTKQLTTSSTGAFAPDFPAVCPYITAVGATQIPSGGDVSSQEVACQTGIFSGGGFSNNFALPQYQAAAVQSYLQNYLTPNPYPNLFNNNGSARAYPDVSVDGLNYLCVIDGIGMQVAGTSASAPVFAAIVYLVNQARMNTGKSSVGFINPALYANPWTLNDIVGGSNPGCGTTGFNATEGWDPVTGLGTPNYPRLVDLFAKQLA